MDLVQEALQDCQVSSDAPYHVSIVVTERAGHPDGAGDIALGTSVFCDNADEVMEALKLFRKDAALKEFLSS